MKDEPDSSERRTPTTGSDLVIPLIAIGFTVYYIVSILDAPWSAKVSTYFIGSVLVMGIIGLSLANAIFIDEMTADNTDAVEEKVDRLHEEIRALRAELRKDRSR